jgi:hypothetical protein
MKCINCKSEDLIKIHDPRRFIRGFNKGDMVEYACPRCHASMKVDVENGQIIVSTSKENKVGGERIITAMPISLIEKIR